MSIDPRYLDFGSWMSLLIWWPVAQVLDAYGSRFHDLFQRPSLRQYPDGTLELNSTPDIAAAWKLIEDYGRSGFHIRQNTSFRALASFPQREYRLLTTMDYFERIGGEQDLLVCPTFAGAVEPGESKPGRLSVRVRFLEPLSRKLVGQFRIAMEAWGNSVAAQGIFGEGPARLEAASPVVKRSWATLYVDHGLSGQNTLNWLTLSVLNFAAKTVPITEIRYGERS